jgi:hypothetical protein
MFALFGQGLADDIELVRGVAMRSGQAIVNQHAASHSQVLIPPLQEGLFDESWRIRQSSVELLGTLMYRIAGVKAITTADTEAEAEDAVDTFVPGTTRTSRFCGEACFFVFFALNPGGCGYSGHHRASDWCSDT